MNAINPVMNHSTDTLKLLLDEAMELANKFLVIAEVHSKGTDNALAGLAKQLDELESKVWDAEDATPFC